MIAWPALCLLACPGLLFAESPTTAPVSLIEHVGLHSGSRAPFIHTINLYDTDGTVINPAKSTAPFSFAFVSVWPGARRDEATAGTYSGAWRDPSE